LHDLPSYIIPQTVQENTVSLKKKNQPRNRERRNDPLKTFEKIGSNLGEPKKTRAPSKLARKMKKAEEKSQRKRNRTDEDIERSMESIGSTDKKWYKRKQNKRSHTEKN